MELNLLLLCFSVAVCTYALVARPGGEKGTDRFFKGRGYAVAVAAVFALAVVVRVYRFGGVPSGMNQDGAMAAVDAHALADYGTDRFGMWMPAYFTAWGYGQMSVLMSWLMVPFIKLFGLSVVTSRLPMLLASLAGIWVLYRFTERLFGRTAALITLLFLAVNPWHIMQSRWALECNLLPHFLLFSVYFLYRGVEKRAYLYISMVFFALTMYTYGIAFFSVPLLMLALCVYLLVKKRIKPWEAGAAAAVYFAIAWPIFAVVVINTFKLQTLYTPFVTVPFFPDSIRTNDLVVYSPDFIGQLLHNVRSFVDMALLERGDFSWSFVPGYGHMYLFTLPFTLLGLWAFARRRRLAAEAEGGEAAPAPLPMAEEPSAASGRFFLAAWLCAALFTGLMVNGVNTNRINIIFYPMCVLASLGILYAVTRTARGGRLAVAVSLAFALGFAGFTSAYFGEHSQVLARDFCSGLPEAIEYADAQDADYVYVTSYTRDENAFTCSEIYTLFAADIDAKYFQGKADAYGPKGEKRLPYQQRYRYMDFDTLSIGEIADAVYVFNLEESYLFDPEYFDIAYFGGFGVATQRVYG